MITSLALLVLSYAATLATASQPQSPLQHDAESVEVPQEQHQHSSSGPGILACTYQTATSYQQIARDAPTASFPQSRLFNVSQASGGLHNIDTLVRFSGIPSGAYGCQLSVSFSANYPINSSENAQLNVYSLPKDISKSDTYATYFPSGGRGTPSGSFLFATVTVLPGSKAVLNSQSCAAAGRYLFQIASDTAKASVAFVSAGNSATGIDGFYLSYNC